MLKLCGECNSEKELSEFYTKTRYRKYPSSKAGVSSNCKECDRTLRTEYVRANPEKKWLSDRSRHLKRYNLTLAGYNDLFSKQGGCCAGCKRHQTDFNRNFSVDHDHKTGAVRGLLCVSCNLILGYASDEKATLLSLVKYLDNHKPDLADYNSKIVELKLPKKVG